jgi:hypothetical protein
MEKNNLLNNSFYLYPKSSNHKIMWKKNDNIKTCDLNSNCTELEFNIRQNKIVKHKTFTNSNKIDNKIDNKENFICISCFGVNTNKIRNTINYDIIVFFLLLILIIILSLKSIK